MAGLALGACGDGSGGEGQPLKPEGLTYATQTATWTVGSAIAADEPSNTGGAISSYAVSPTLPPGISIDAKTGVISGTPTAVTPQADYEVTGSNAAGTSTVTLSFTVNDVAPAELAYAGSPAVATLGAPLSLSPTSKGGAVVSYSVSPALPAGLSLDAKTGVIAGTPGALQAAVSYTVTATNSGGSTTATLSITVNDLPPSGLTYSANPAAYTQGTAITDNTPSSSGGAVVSYSITPAPPAGLSLDASTGVLSGTPTAVSSATDYTVTATNSGGSTSATVNVTVVKPPPSVTAASAVDDPLYGPAATARYPASATDGTNQLYLWTDNRTAGVGRLFAARLAPDGTVLDPAGVELAEVSGGSVTAKVVWNGAFYFVCDLRAANINSVQHLSLGCFTLSADLTTLGERTEVNSVATSNGDGSIAGMGVAWNPDDGQFLVAWINESYSSRTAPFKGVRFDASGAVIDASPVILRPTGAGAYDYDRSFGNIVYGGGYYLISSSEGGSACSGYTAEFTRVKASDLSGGANYGLLSPTCEQVSLSSFAYDASANQFLVTSALYSSNTQSVFVQSLSNNVGDTTGTLSARTTLETSVPGVFLRGTSIAFNGANKLIAVSMSAPPVTVYAVDGSNQVTASASLAAPTIPDGQSYESRGVVAQRSSDGWTVTVGDNRVGAGLYAVRLTDALTTTDGAGIVAATGANSQDVPCVASGGPGNGWLVAWFDSHAGNNFYARRLASDGTPLDAAPLVLGTTNSGPRGCAAAYSAGTYLVAWVNESGTAVASRLDAATGAVLDATPFSLGAAPAYARPGLAGGTNGFLAIWNGNSAACGANYCSWPLMGAHVGVDGTVAEAGGFLISDVTGLGMNSISGAGADVWFDGTAYQTAYGLAVDYGTAHFFNRAIPESGAPSDPAVEVGSFTGTSYLGPSIAAGAAGGSVIAWTEFAAGGASVNARAVLDGVAQGAGPIQLVTGSGATTPGPVQLVSDGTTSWLALQSGGFTFNYYLSSSAPASVSVRPIDADLGVGDALQLGDTGLALPSFSFAGDQSGTVLSACSAWDPTLYAARLAVRRVQ